MLQFECKLCPISLCLNTMFLARSAIWEGCKTFRGRASMEEVDHWEQAFWLYGMTILLIHFLLLHVNAM